MTLTMKSLKPVFPGQDNKYKDRSTGACSTFTYPCGRNLLHLTTPMEMQSASPHRHRRCDGGQLNINTIDWKGKSRGLFFHHPQGNVNVICVKLSEDCKDPVPVICRERTKTRCTQTRYRESSAQTRPYLPEVSDDKENYKDFETYQISKLIKSFEPPGEYEAKIVERYRRKRQYQNALQLNKDDKKKHRVILEAMEWEDWCAREEDIQSCQMLRMEIVHRLCQQREKKLYESSTKRISSSYERINARRIAQMKKINIEFDRGMRQLEAKKRQIPRFYRKGNIIKEHIDPASDLRAPQMRFGVNPNRRHFVGFRKNFNDRIDNLDKEKDEGGLASLTCPFRKLKTWSKPKQRMMEVTQRFCSDENLKGLYESLKGLRVTSEAFKASPKCLKKRVKLMQPITSLQFQKVDNEIYNQDSSLTEEFMEEQEDESLYEATKEESFCINEPFSEVPSEELPLKQNKTNDEEISSIVGEFEGDTLGKLLQFLDDELERLKVQKKFQSIHMLAQNERWRREAFEAGLRQKENKKREQLEDLFQAAPELHSNPASLFLESVLEEEFSFTAENLSREKIIEMADEIDNDVFECIKLQGIDEQIYNRMVINDIVKNQVFAVAKKRFEEMKTEKLEKAKLRAIEEELYASVEKALYEELKTPDSITIVGELLDELIDDAVTYDFNIITPSTSDSNFDTGNEINAIIDKLLKISLSKPNEKDSFMNSSEWEDHLIAEKEAKAIIRKLVRKVVQDERWKSEGERIVEKTLSETFNEAVNEIECLKASQKVKNNDKLNDIISEIHKRMLECQKSNESFNVNSSDNMISSFLKSVPSNMNILDYDLATKKIFDTNSSESDELLGFQLAKKVNYVNTAFLDQYETFDLGRRHEHFNIMEKTERLKFTDDISSKSETSERNIWKSFPYEELNASGKLSSTLKNIVPPEFLDNERQKLEVSGRSVKRMSCPLAKNCSDISITERRVSI